MKRDIVREYFERAGPEMRDMFDRTRPDLEQEESPGGNRGEIKYETNPTRKTQIGTP